MCASERGLWSTGTELLFRQRLQDTNHARNAQQERTTRKQWRNIGVEKLGATLSGQFTEYATMTASGKETETRN